MEARVKKLSQYFRSGILAIVAIPTGDPSLWKELRFNSIPANKVTYDQSFLQIEVNQSASPLIYRFERIKNVDEVSLQLEISGQMNQDQFKKWKDFEEDSYLRVGLIATGSKRPSRLKLFFAPDWVKTLFSLAPEGVGLDQIHFFNVAVQSHLIGKRRNHAKSEYISEEILIARENRQERISVQIRPTSPMKITGFWLSADGDDSRSNFSLKIKNFQFNENIEE